MAETLSNMLELGTAIPDFKLYDTENNPVSPDLFKNSKALLVVFICNHCPFVRHIIKDFSTLAAEYKNKNTGIIAINSNDTENYPDDAPPKMKEFANKYGFTFPYLFDETQETAKAFKAACTPDFFLFDEQRKLVYRGQMDDSRLGNNLPITGTDLRNAIDALLSDQIVSDRQKPSIGCNIKWKPGNEPMWFK